MGVSVPSLLIESTDSMIPVINIIIIIIAIEWHLRRRQCAYTAGYVYIAYLLLIN